MRAFALCALLAIASCAPRITAAGPNSVTVDRDTMVSSRAEVQAMADEYCGRNGRVARELHSEPSFFTRPTVSFQCVAP